MRKSTKNDHPSVSELTPKQRRFVAEFLKDQNATHAAIRAGYSKKTARFQASDLLTRPHIKAAVDAKLTEVAEAAGVSAVWILERLREVVERCMQRIPVMIRDHKDGRKFIQKTDENGEGVWEFDSAGANRSLELLGKNKALFTENVKHSGTLTLEKLLAGTWDSVAP